MNIDVAEQINSKLPLKLIHAIQDPQKWSDVLDYIIQTTGAKAAIITLRDKANCQIVTDADLEQKFHSPLIRGFSHEAIVHYLTELRTIDPWAEFQRTHYPYRPVQMSKVCPTHSIKGTAFFDWLKSEGFEDTIVFELDRMAGYWTAINLFLEDSTGPQGEATFAFANTNYSLLCSAWQASQDLARSRQTNIALLTEAASGGAPVCLAGANGELIECNDLFLEIIATDAIRLSGSGQKLSFANVVSIKGLTRWEQHRFLTHQADSGPVSLAARPVDPDPLFADKREQLWLLTCTTSEISPTASGQVTARNLYALTSQERILYDAIAAGKSVTAAGASVGLKRSRAFEVWSSVKEKLSITSAHQLRS